MAVLYEMRTVIQVNPNKKKRSTFLGMLRLHKKT